MTADIRIGAHEVGPGHPPFVIAEMSGNHNGDLDRALAIVDAVAETGAHAVKLQTYRPDTHHHRRRHPGVPDRCRARAVGRREPVQALRTGSHAVGLARPALRARPELGPGGLLQPVRPHGRGAAGVPGRAGVQDRVVRDRRPAVDRAGARTGKPLVISTGMATRRGDRRGCAHRPRRRATTGIVLLACTATYPASPRESNLRRLPRAGRAFDVRSSGSPTTPRASGHRSPRSRWAQWHREARHAGPRGRRRRLGVLAGARRAGRPGRRDAPGVGGARRARAGPARSEKEGLRLRRSLYVVEDVRAGDEVTAANVRSIRPAGGLAPAEITRSWAAPSASTPRRARP